MASGNKEFGKRIKELRESKGLTQEQLAEKVGIDYQSISRLKQVIILQTIKNQKRYLWRLIVH